MAEIDRSLIGVWGPEAKMHVELGKVREFARAVKDDKRIYRDGMLTPPTFLMTLAHWIGDLGQTRSAVKLDYRRLLHGEQEFEYVKPIRAGSAAVKLPLTATSPVCRSATTSPSTRCSPSSSYLRVTRPLHVIVSPGHTRVAKRTL